MKFDWHMVLTFIRLSQLLPGMLLLRLLANQVAQECRQPLKQL